MGGSTLGRYELITQIGQGGMAEVHLALHRGPAGFEKLVVVKVIHASLADEKQVVTSLLDEAKLAALIKHPNVVDMYELGEENGRYFLAMEYLEGEPLLAVLEAGHRGPRLDPLSMARIVADTAEGLEAAHKLKDRDGSPLELVHDDISLGNIVVLYSGQVKLVDFGVAKAKHTAETTDKIYGKPGYMAPEKLDGKTADRRSDIWSLGVVLWEALAQKRLFRGDTATETIREVRYVKITPPSAANPSVPPELDAIAMKALEREPAKRYQTAKELAIAIEDALRAKNFDAKNDRIAAYMQRTFAEHITAREKLVAEVSRRSRPSDAMLEAAFGPSKIGDAPLVEPDTEAPASTERLRNPFDDGDIGSTVADLIPPDPAASRSTRHRPDPSWALSPHAGSIDKLQSWVQQEREGRSHRHLVPYAIGTVALIGILVAIVMATRDDDKAHTAAAHDATVVIEADAAVVVMTPVVDAAEDASELMAMAAVDAPEAPPEVPADAPPAEIAMEPPPDAGGVAVKRPVRAPQRPAEQLYAEGMQWFRKGEPRKALASLTEARRSNERYAPAWYGLGVVYEQLGVKSSARRAYQRYLKLAPKAANAQLVRERLGRL